MSPLKFIRTYFRVRSQKSLDARALALGRPERLELDAEQAELVSELYVTQRLGASDVAKGFYKTYPRTGFRYFTALNNTGEALEYGRFDYAMDGVELINAAMVTLGAMKQHDDGEWYYQLAHPMVRRTAEVAEESMAAIQKHNPSGGMLGLRG